MILRILIIFILGTTVLKSETYYIWTEDNVKHYTNMEQKASESQPDNLELRNFKNRNRPEQNGTYYDQNTESNAHEKTTIDSDNEQKTKEYWQSRMNNINSLITKKENQIEDINKRIEQLDREIEYLLINGYSADHMIYELRTLENSIPPLKSRINSLEEKKKNLREQARKKGIPPGYLRP